MNITGINFIQGLNAKKTQNQPFGRFVIDYDAGYSDGNSKHKSAHIFTKLVSLIENEGIPEKLDMLQDKGFTLTANIYDTDSGNDTCLSYILSNSQGELIHQSKPETFMDAKARFNGILQTCIDFIPKIIVSQTLPTKRTENRTLGRFVIDYDATCIDENFKYKGFCIINNLASFLYQDGIAEKLDKLRKKGLTVTAKVNDTNDRKDTRLTYVLSDSQGELKHIEKPPTLGGAQDGFNEILQEGIDFNA